MMTQEPPVLVIVRGLPGSGKSTIAKSMALYEHYEADMFFTDSDGTYKYDRQLIGRAHEWCQRETFKALANGKRVVVSNTFTRLSEMQPYLDMAKTFGIEPVIIEAAGNWQSVHNVPAESIDRMRQRWEQIPTPHHNAQADAGVEPGTQPERVRGDF